MTTREVTDVPVVRSDAFVEVYANYVSFAAGAWDMTIMFGRSVADDPQHPRIEQRAAVSLSPQTTKALAEILHTHVQRYEARYGEIRLTSIS